MAISLDAFLYAITSNETGSYKNPYSAVGPPTRDGNRAYGKYQIMDFNIPVWSKQYLGRKISLSQYRNSPEIQEELARAVLTDYYNKYGAEGAAAKWFSGEANPNSNASDGHWTVRQYVAEMQKAAYKYSGDSGSGYTRQRGRAGGSASSGSGGRTTPSIDRSQLAEQYGMMEALLNSVPELRSLFNNAVSGTWSADQFQAKLRNTTWWKTHSETERNYLIKSFSDPGQWRKEREDARFRIGELGNQLGLFNVMGNQKLIDHLIYGVTYHGWSDAQLKYQMGQFLMSPPEGGLAGAGGQFQMQMASLAWANGVKLDQNWYTERYRHILQGISTEQQAQQDIRNRAASMFPGFREQIMSGMNMADIASPYLQGMSSILEVNPGELDLFDPTIKSALNYKDPKTGVVGSKPLWQYEVDLRKDPRWLQTNNAREGIMTAAHKVAQDFGVLF